MPEIREDYTSPGRLWEDSVEVMFELRLERWVEIGQVNKGKGIYKQRE